MVVESIFRKFRKAIWRPFIAGIKSYDLISEGDSIAVCISGGKDSFLLALLLKELQKHRVTDFHLSFMVMDPGYMQDDLSLILANAEKLGIPITVFQSGIFEVVKDAGGSPCYLCARMRRGHLYSQAQKLGANKIALGHHLSDVVETTLMGMLFGSQNQTMMPKLRSKNFRPMELVRPLYCVTEDAILAWKKYNGLEFSGCACPLKYKCASTGDETGSKRQEVKEILRQLKERGSRNVEKSVFKSLQMLNLDTAIGYRKNGREHNFLDDYYMKGDNLP